MTCIYINITIWQPITHAYHIIGSLTEPKSKKLACLHGNPISYLCWNVKIRSNIVLERGNPIISGRFNSIQVSMLEHDDPFPNHTPQSQSQVHHQDHRSTSWFHSFIIHLFELQQTDHYCDIHIHTSIMM